MHLNKGALDRHITGNYGENQFNNSPDTDNLLPDWWFSSEPHIIKDCLEVMSDMPDGCIDMILCDLPYGITSRNKWDTIIPLDELWKQYERIIKKNGAIVLTAVQPFTSMLVMSNKKLFKYEWIWEKTRPVGFLNAKKQPLRIHESVLVFYLQQATYNPQGVIDCKPKLNKRTTSGDNYRSAGLENIQTKTNYPRDVIKIASEGKTKHPTQKPVELFEYLIKTYTNKGDIVFDNCLGSGTTLVACQNTNRIGLGCEIEQKYAGIINERLGR